LWRARFYQVLDDVKQRVPSYEEVVLVHHDDADGLSSAALTTRALEALGVRVHRICLEKLFLEVVEDLMKKWNALVFVDIASAHVDFLEAKAREDQFIMILDHHKPRGEPQHVLDLNLERWGLSGDRDFSASTLCYLFYREITGDRSLSYLGLVGAEELPEKGIVVNDTLKDARDSGAVTEGKREELIAVPLNMPVKTVFSTLQVLGPVGYYKGGPELGVSLCLGERVEVALKHAEEWRGARKQANRKLIAILWKGELKQGKRVQWFHDHGVFQGMGTKVIGTFSSYLSYQRRLINPSKYILGWMKMPQQIPGWGSLETAYSKFSTRIPVVMRKKVERGALPGLMDILNVLSTPVLVDGHQAAASGLVREGEEVRLVQEFDEVADSMIR